MMKGKKLEEYIILTALGNFFAEHSGLATYEALGNGELLEDDVIWEPFEYNDADMMSELVEDNISMLKQFAQDIQK